MNNSTPSWWRCEEGAAAAETGLVMGVVLLLVVGTFECGRTFWTYNTMLLAVEQAGRYAMLHRNHLPQMCGAQIQAVNCPAASNTPLANCAASRAQEVLWNYQLRDIGVSVKEDATSVPPVITICASYSFNFLVPQLLPNGPLDLTSRVTVPLI